MQQKAAKQGVGEVARFFDMTPWEVGLALDSFAGQQRSCLQKLHLQAALFALAFHAPSGLPSLSPPVPEECMTPDEMKQRLLSWRRKENQ